MSGGIRRDFPDRLRRLFVLSISVPAVLGDAIRLRAGICAMRSKFRKRSRSRCFRCMPATARAPGKTIRRFWMPLICSRHRFSTCCEPYWREQIAVLIFEFGAFPNTSYRDAAQFVRRTGSVPGASARRFSLRHRDPQSGIPAPEYFACLRRHGVAHVFNAWTRMPELSDQMRCRKYTLPISRWSRALLRRGRPV